MKLRAISFLVYLTSMSLMNGLWAQEDLSYQLPPEEILELADVKLPPSTLINSKGDLMILRFRNQYKSIAELSEPEMRLGGLRINPAANIGSRTRYYTDLKIQVVGQKEAENVKGLPSDMRLANFSWSPDEQWMAFTNTVGTGVELWVLDIGGRSAKRLTGPVLNGNMGSPFSWSRDSKQLLVKQIPDSRKSLVDQASSIPTGPRVSTNDAGTKAQNRTYQDLLKNKADEFNFEQLVRSDLYMVALDGKAVMWKQTDMYSGVSFSPDGKYVLVTTVGKPFSYLVPYYRFPAKAIVYDNGGQLIKTILDKPLTEEMPKGFMAVRKGRRNIQWRADQPATLYWAEALDEGDPQKEVPFRDVVMQLPAPFEGSPAELIKTKTRYNGIIWGTGNVAIARDYWWNTRMVRTSLFDPSDHGKEPKLLSEVNFQDRYNDPGSFVTHKNEYGRYVLAMEKNSLFLNGAGHSPEGVLPFIDELNIKSGKKNRLWRAENDQTYVRIYDVLDLNAGKMLIMIESPERYPNYYLGNFRKKTEPEQITFNKNPFTGIQGAYKEVIKYKREDGVELSATLYLPVGYDREKKEKLPMLMWAYPNEFKDKSSAGQVTASPYEFTYPWYGSPLFWLTRGYAILDDAAFPIVGEGDNEPNDTFIPQLVANAKAAIDAVDELGYIDREKVAVGGHSYGAFMTANLLTHSDLFAAGIARSGAYNRTLTPFGFQSEERNYWEAPEVYYQMAPFMHADKMDHPLLMIHGEADNNSGTYPMQSERYFNALKGLGATVRLVMLPKESHGYSARESVLHILWEQDQWLEKYVKGKSD